MPTFGREIIHLWPWMDNRDNVDFNDYIDDFDYYNYSAIGNSPASINDNMEFTINPNPGTWELREFCSTDDTDNGVAHFSINGGPDLGTSDHGNATGFTRWQDLSTPGLVFTEPGDFKVSMDSTNTPGFVNNLTMMTLRRTGP